MSRRHEVRQGECLSSIALLHGFAPDTLWNHSVNAPLREQRGDRNVLLPGDVIHVPELRQASEPKADGQRHRFRRRGLPEKLALQLLDHGEPREDVRYQLSIDGRLHEGQTDNEGMLEHAIVPDARLATLIVDGLEEYRLVIGAIDPKDTPSGIRHRLVNLGLLAAADVPDDEFALALRRFQAEHDLDPTGTGDAATVDKLADVHGY